MRRVAALIAAAPAVASDAALRGLVLEALREAMENPWKTHGKPMENPWKTHGLHVFFIATNTVSSTDCRYVPLGGLLGKNFSPPCDAVQTNEGNVCLFQFPALVGQPDGGHFCDQRK